MKKRGWIVLFLAFPLWMQGQSAREEIGKNPALAAGKYYAYQAPEEKLTPAPAGYEPFYIHVCPAWFPVSYKREEVCRAVVTPS